MGDDFKMPDLGGLMQAARKMQEDMQRAQAELEKKVVEASAGGGMVNVVVNGRLEILRVTIDPNVVDPKDVGMLQDLIVAAINQALNKAKALAQGEMAKLTGGISIPGMPQLF